MKTKWLKVVECAVVGLATWFVAYGEISDFSAAVPNPAHCPVESSRRSETGAVGVAGKICDFSSVENRKSNCVEVRSRRSEAERQFLLFLLKLSFQVWLALREGTQDTPAKQVFWSKLVLWLVVGR